MQNRSEACERNQDPILAELRRHLPQQSPYRIVEIGSGSGQHAIYFNQQQPNWGWQTTEMPENLAALSANLQTYAAHLPEPQPLDVRQFETDLPAADAYYTANTLHIMSAAAVEQLFQGLTPSLSPQSRFIIYGPFRYEGNFTSDSNARFDDWLKNRDPLSGIRDFEWIQQLAEAAGLQLVEDIPMPANNQLLIWQSPAN